MGFLSALAKIGGFATKFLPIPGAGFVGDAIGAAGEALGAGAQAAASNRGTKIDVGLAEEQMNRLSQKTASFSQTHRNHLKSRERHVSQRIHQRVVRHHQ